MLKFLTAYAYRIDLCSFSASDSACFDKSLSAIINRSYCARTYLCDVEDIHQTNFNPFFCCVCVVVSVFLSGEEEKWHFVKVFSPFMGSFVRFVRACTRSFRRERKES